MASRLETEGLRDYRRGSETLSNEVSRLSETADVITLDQREQVFRALLRDTLMHNIVHQIRSDEETLKQLIAQHLVPLGHREPDYVATARRFLGVPYLWGGRSSLGLDCSALVQLALQAAGIACPRDSDMQAGLGSAVDFGGDISKLKRGDLVYWQVHIGFVAGEGRFLHANAHHMAVAEEPLADAIQRIRAVGQEILTVRRL